MAKMEYTPKYAVSGKAMNLIAEIAAVLAGKRMVATRREIDEVKGSHRAYEKIETFNPYSVKDLLKAHALMTKRLVERPGEFRKCAVGMMNGAGEVVQLADAKKLIEADLMEAK